MTENVFKKIPSIQEDYYKVKRINNSLLSSINPEQGGSPKKYLKDFEGDKEEKYSKSLESGTILHKYCENPSEFETLFFDKPNDKLGLVADKAIELFKNNILPEPDEDAILLSAARAVGWNNNWKDDAIIKNTRQLLPYIEEVLETKDLIGLTIQQKTMLDNCSSSLRNHKRANELLFTVNEFANIEYHNEIAIYFTASDLECKAKLDRLIINHDTKEIYVIDLKTTSGSVYKFQESLDKYHYYRQIAFYSRAIKTYYPDYKVISYFVVVETIGNYNTAVYKVNSETIDRGILEAYDLLARINWHNMNGFEYSFEESNNNCELNI